ncbi:MAG: hypothetical protein JO307_24060 [Bryobacterales bacterium]|nr:hypothetical protein [Bryobacterales bacterium]MBV9398976.1 hypothetical protein [Bryobacterales bacterium]
MLKYLSAFIVLLGGQSAVWANVLTPGTQIQARTDAPIYVSNWDRGRIYRGHVAKDIFAADGDLAVPRGADVELIVRETGPGQMELDLDPLPSTAALRNGHDRSPIQYAAKLLQ